MQIQDVLHVGGKPFVRESEESWLWGGWELRVRFPPRGEEHVLNLCLINTVRSESTTILVVDLTCHPRKEYTRLVEYAVDYHGLRLASGWDGSWDNLPPDTDRYRYFECCLDACGRRRTLTVSGGKYPDVNLCVTSPAKTKRIVFSRLSFDVFADSEDVPQSPDYMRGLLTTFRDLFPCQGLKRPRPQKTKTSGAV